LQRIHELELQLKGKEEERRLTELCVSEYAELVRSLEGRASVTTKPSPIQQTASETSSIDTLVSSESPSPNGTRPSKPIDTLAEGLQGLQRLLAESHDETTRLRMEIHNLQAALATCKGNLEAANRSAEEDRVEKSKALTEVEKLKNSDRGAAQMVERYMAFSQNTTNLLQEAMRSLKSRHAAAVSTFETMLSVEADGREREAREVERLRGALDELAGEMAKEGFGRRREVALRLAMLEREERLKELLAGWARKFKERSSSLSEVTNDSEHAKLLEGALDQAEALVQRIDVVSTRNSQTDSTDGSLRISMALLEVKNILARLDQETLRNLQLEKQLAARSKEQVPGPQPQPALDDVQNTPLPIDTSSSPESEMADATVEQVETQREPELTPPSATPPVEDSEPSELVAVEAPPLDDQRPQPTEELPPVATPVAQDHGVPVDHVSHDDDGPISEHIQRRLDSLAAVGSRYDTLQRVFRDCHRALDALKAELRTSMPATFPTDHIKPSRARRLSNWLAGSRPSSPTFGTSSNSPHPENNRKEAVVLNTAVQRLDDFCEDARVELEILVADEARIANGYEALLSLSSSAAPLDEKLLREIDEFIDGTAASVVKAKSTFERKVGDLEHDISTIKRTLHAQMIDGAENAIDGEQTEATSGHPISGNWRGWTSSLSLANPASIPPSKSMPPPQAFGSVTAAARGPIPRSPSLASLHSATPASPVSPFESMGLRIPMPAIGAPRSPPAVGWISGLGAVGMGQRQGPISGVGTAFGFGMGLRGHADVRRPSITPTTSASGSGLTREQGEDDIE
jgi:hypothetical protein